MSGVTADTCQQVIEVLRPSNWKMWYATEVFVDCCEEADGADPIRITGYPQVNGIDLTQGQDSVVSS
jgi:hypothetical protein